MMDEVREPVRRLAATSLAAGRPLDWFEAVYAHANRNPATIPWADMHVNPNLWSWAEPRGLQQGKQALVVGCGLGDDAEALATLAYAVTAFDISRSCIDWCQHRFPITRVKYVTANLFDPPEDWARRFDLVLESYTLQVLPRNVHALAMQRIADCVAEQGELLVIARGRAPSDDPGSMPWPLTREDLAGFVAAGLRDVAWEDFYDIEEPPVRRFRVTFARHTR